MNPNKYGFLDIPRQMVPLPPYYFEVTVTDGVVGLNVVMMNGLGVLQVLFVSFTKGPGGSPMYSSSQPRSPH